MRDFRVREGKIYRRGWRRTDAGDGVKPEFREFIESFPPMQRMGTPDDVANVVEYLAGTWRRLREGSI